MRTNQTKTPAAISTIGIDIGKITFRLIGLDKRGAIVLQQKGLAQPARAPAGERPALPDRHGGLFRGPPHRPPARSARP